MSKSTIKIAFIANQEEFDELTERYLPVEKNSFGRLSDFSFDVPRIYFYEQYSCERGCLCRGCEDYYTLFYNTNAEINSIIDNLKKEKSQIDNRIKLIEDGFKLNKENHIGYTEDYIPEQQYRDWM